MTNLVSQVVSRSHDFCKTKTKKTVDSGVSTTSEAKSKDISHEGLSNDLQ